MNQLRSRVAKKAGSFLKKAQRAPAPPAPAAPTDVAPPVPGAPAAPVPGTPPAAPKPPVGAPPAAPKAPGVPAPPGAPGAPQKTKEEVEQDVEKDFRREKQQELRQKNIEEKVTGLGEQLDGLTRSIDKLVNMIQKGQGGPTDYEEKFEELKEDDDEDLSSSEFGLGDNDKSILVSKEGHQMPTKEELRNARNQRLKAEDLEYHTNNPPNKKYKLQMPAPQITKLKKAPEDWGQYRMKASDLALDLSADEKEWSVVNKHTDQVFFKIHPTAETEEVFATEDFARAIINDIQKMGFKEAMEKYAAVPFGLMKDKKEDKPDLLKMKLKKKEDPDSLKMKLKKKDDNKVVKKKLDVEEKEDEDIEACGPSTKMSAEAEAEEAETEEASVEESPPLQEKEEESLEAPTASAADFARKFSRAFRLALSAQNKNLIANPLKSALFEAMQHVGVDRPDRIIEAAFARAAAEQFEVALAKTAEYLEMGDQSFIEMEAQIGELQTQQPDVKEPSVEELTAEERKMIASKLRARASKSSLPFNSATAMSPSTGRQQLLDNALPRPKLWGIKSLVEK